MTNKFFQDLLNRLDEKIDDLTSSYNQLPEEHERTIKAKALGEKRRFEGLTCTTKTQIQEIGPAIELSSQVVDGRRWNLGLSTGGHHATKIFFALDMAKLGIFSLAWILSGLRLASWQGLITYLLMAVCALVSYKASRVVWQRLPDGRLWTLIIILAFLLLTSEAWMTRLDIPLEYRFILDFPGQDTHETSINIYKVTETLILIFVTFLTARTLDFYLYRAVGLWVISNTEKHTEAAFHTSRIVLGLLNICHLLDESAKIKTGYISYLGNDTRGHIIDQIESTSRIARGPWISSMRTGNRAMDREISRRGAALSRKVLNWRNKVALGGVNISVVRDSCHETLLHVATGDWDQISHEEETEATPRKLDYMVGILKILGVSTVSLLVLWTNQKMSWIPQNYEQTASAIFIALPVIQILAFANPKITERIESTKDFASFIKG